MLLAVAAARMLMQQIATNDCFEKSWARHEAVVLDGLDREAAHHVLSLKALSDCPFLLSSRSKPPHIDGWRVDAWPHEPLSALEDGGTLVVNGAAETMPEVAQLALASIDMLRLPSSINCYATNAGVAVSAPPHSDAQDLVAIQCAGSQRWRVWRGQEADVGKLESWMPSRAADIEVQLCVGDALFIPVGWPHATDTLDASDASLHVTLGWDHQIFGLERPATLRDPPVDAMKAYHTRLLEAQSALYTDVASSVSAADAARDWARRYRSFALTVAEATRLVFGPPAAQAEDGDSYEAAIDLYIRNKLQSRGFLL